MWNDQSDIFKINFSKFEILQVRRVLIYIIYDQIRLMAKFLNLFISWPTLFFKSSFIDRVCNDKKFIVFYQSIYMFCASEIVSQLPRFWSIFVNLVIKLKFYTHKFNNKSERFSFNDVCLCEKTNIKNKTWTQ